MALFILDLPFFILIHLAGFEVDELQLMLSNMHKTLTLLSMHQILYRDSTFVSFGFDRITLHILKHSIVSSVDGRHKSRTKYNAEFLEKKRKTKAKEREREGVKRRENQRKFSSLYISDAFASFQHHHSFSNAANNSTETIKEGNNTSNANIHSEEGERKNKKINPEQACNINDNYK